MKPKYYDIISRAVETGATMGYRHARKHTDNLNEEHVVESIREAVMSELCEVFTFDDEVKSD